ncbi:histidine kinase [Actinomadura darangshiensis]|uniref:Histidine kinase n=1 Tax=Actinomadura darangshiensis TaxID=705336 RepID=A0A4R5BQB0_9ACTN|nr:ATP-binding protein [Actinomadura darangshiensis]TDD89111.1 histidine kinase [Actinomadura darangshiensis]
MPELVLSASDDHVQRIASEKDPVRAIIELIWNGLDAESDRIDISFERGELEAVNKVIVRDWGHGISVDEVARTFGEIGNSWKSRAKRSKNGKRKVWGSKGQGRLHAFALGDRIRWVSISDDTAGKRWKLTINGSRFDRHRFNYESVELAGRERSGTVFTAFNDSQTARVQRLASPRARESVAATFAPFLLNNPNVEIFYDGSLIDVTDQISENRLLDRTIETEEGRVSYAIRIIEWKAGKHHSIYYGESIDHAVHEVDGKDIEPRYNFSVYVAWPGFSESGEDVALGELAPSPVAEIVRDVREAVRDYFSWRRRQDRRSQIEHWKQTGVYPYKEPPQNEVERVEQATFDLVSGTLSGHIAQGKMSAGLTLHLLQNVLRHEPESLLKILHEVLALPTSDRDALTELIDSTSLSNIIRSTSKIADRGRFLVALDHIVYDAVGSKDVKEKDHLHRMLEKELWVFGEEYNVMRSERGLTEALRTHLKLTGLPTDKIRPVRTPEGKSGRLDLHLAVSKREHGRVRHLVVELKAPGVLLGRKEIDQVEDYGNTVISDVRFRDPAAMWDFILVGSRISDTARNRMHGDNARGLFYEPPSRDEMQPKVRAFVRSWREIIDENRSRLEFFSDALEHDPSLPESLAYLRKVHSRALPEQLRQGQEDASPQGESPTG